jgi:hypothetical protein
MKWIPGTYSANFMVRSSQTILPNIAYVNFWIFRKPWLGVSKTVDQEHDDYEGVVDHESDELEVITSISL